MYWIEEARELVTKIRNAKQEMDFNKEDYKESEVLFRLQAIQDMLIIAHNEAMELVRSWERITRTGGLT